MAAMKIGPSTQNKVFHKILHSWTLLDTLQNDHWKY
jgi:hypothetical protein